MQAANSKLLAQIIESRRGALDRALFYFGRGGSQEGLEIAPDFGMAADKKRPEKRGSGEEGKSSPDRKEGFTALCAVLLNADQRLGGRGNPFVDELIIKYDLAVIMSWKCAFLEFLNGSVTIRPFSTRNTCDMQE